MKFRKHALQQGQRRGIAPEMAELIVAHGEEFNGGRGHRIYRVSRAEMSFLRNDCPPMLWKRYRDRMKNIASVVSEQQEIVTTMHRYRPLWKK